MHHLRPFIFVSIPRSASSTVHYIMGLSGPKDRSDPADRGIMDNHATCEKLVERYGADEFTRRYKFSFVRNPWDRCVSWYLHHLHMPPYRDLTFKQWIKAGMPHHWDVQNETEYRGDRTPLEQYRFIADATGKLMVDYVGRTERLVADLKQVMDTLGMILPLSLPKINRANERTDYRRYYDSEMIEWVGKALEADIRMFNYRF